MTDIRFIADRMNPTETTCDKCDGTILESERRAAVTIEWSSCPEGENLQDDWLFCENCATNDPR